MTMEANVLSLQAGYRNPSKREHHFESPSFLRSSWADTSQYSGHFKEEAHFESPASLQASQADI